MKGIVYIFTNPCLEGWVKIGMTERNDIEVRLNELNGPTNIPLSFRCYATYEVENPIEVEKRIHSIIDKIDDTLHAREHLNNGKIREREFFKISPETAYGIFYDIASLRGDLANLKLFEPSSNSQCNNNNIITNRVARQENNTFKSLNISIGEELKYVYDESIVVKVANDVNGVEYKNKIYAISNLALLLYNENRDIKLRTINGWGAFTKNGIRLSNLRNNN